MLGCWDAGIWDAGRWDAGIASVRVYRVTQYLACRYISHPRFLIPSCTQIKIGQLWMQDNYYKGLFLLTFN
jgi:hypothetical protein